MKEAIISNSIRTLRFLNGEMDINAESSEGRFFLRVADVRVDGLHIVGVQGAQGRAGHRRNYGALHLPSSRAEQGVASIGMGRRRQGIVWCSAGYCHSWRRSPRNPFQSSLDVGFGAGTCDSCSR